MFSQTDIANFANVPFNFITTEQTGHLFTITLNRPEKRNAFTPTMVNEIAFALSHAQQQNEIWCVLIKANGPVFCAGMDLNVFQNPELDKPNQRLPVPTAPINLGDAFRVLNKPSIAKVEGAVLAGGFLITTCCTFVVADENAEFSLPEVKRGIFPMQVMSALLNITTPAKALQMCITAEAYSGQVAKEFGLISHLSTKENIDEACNLLVETITSHSPFAISKGIESFRELQNIPEDERFGFLVGRLEEIKNSADAKEGIDAFREKRKPVWKNE
jgi:enoyl-CoA hydratase/carnithine racemase